MDEHEFRVIKRDRRERRRERERERGRWIDRPMDPWMDGCIDTFQALAMLEDNEHNRIESRTDTMILTLLPIMIHNVQFGSIISTAPTLNPST